MGVGLVDESGGHFSNILQGIWKELSKLNDTVCSYENFIAAFEDCSLNDGQDNVLDTPHDEMAYIGMKLDEAFKNPFAIPDPEKPQKEPTSNAVEAIPKPEEMIVDARDSVPEENTITTVEPEIFPDHGHKADIAEPFLPGLVVLGSLDPSSSGIDMAEAHQEHPRSSPIIQSSDVSIRPERIDEVSQNIAGQVHLSPEVQADDQITRASSPAQEVRVLHSKEEAIVASMDATSYASTPNPESVFQPLSFPDIPLGSSSPVSALLKDYEDNLIVENPSGSDSSGFYSPFAFESIPISPSARPRQHESTVDDIAGLEISPSPGMSRRVFLAYLTTIKISQG